MTAIWIVGQEAPGRPVFGIGESVRGEPTWIGTLIVAPCEGFDGTARAALWFLVQEGEARTLERLTYGRIPPGYASTRYMSADFDRVSVAPPLPAGCYVASLDGTGQVRFEVGADGSVLELPEQR
jgi:hypothetical protein